MKKGKETLMKLTADLHSHSGHAGGVGSISLEGIAETMKLKGIDVFGSGDCLQPEWNKFLKDNFTAAEKGLFKIKESENARFLLQTEIIITSPARYGGRKTVHTILLFPTFEATKKAMALLKGWEVKINMGRPFLKCDSSEDVSEKMFSLTGIAPEILVIPAHVLTPQGVYGPERPVTFLADFYGEFASEIYAVETGLSADPEILALIPELDNRALISNSDCHSAALNRVGREYTAYNVTEKSYHGIIEAIKTRSIAYTAEFTPSEGRYFLTGHREGVKGHKKGEYCYYSPDKSPEFCPICSKPLTKGVLERALELGTLQGEPRTLKTITPKQKYLTLIPLTEAIAAGYKVKNSSSKKVLAEFERIIKLVGTEEALWTMDYKDIEEKLKEHAEDSTLAALKDIIDGNYSFTPLGFDGEYGTLELGKKEAWFGHSVVNGGMATLF